MKSKSHWESCMWKETPECAEPLHDSQFRGCVCDLALINIPDLRATFESVRRILQPGGWFVFAITHPCFDTPHAQWTPLPDPEHALARTVTGYCQLLAPTGGELDAELHRNSAYLERRAALASQLASHQGQLTTAPCATQSCQIHLVRSAMLRAPTRSACSV